MIYYGQSNDGCYYPQYSAPASGPVKVLVYKGPTLGNQWDYSGAVDGVNSFFVVDNGPSSGDQYTDIGGSGNPAWVPADAKIHIDFLGGTPQGRAWVDGTGEVAVDTLVGYDPNADNSFSSLPFDTLSYTSEGYDASGKLAFLGNALALVLAGTTLVVEMVHDNSTESISSACHIGLASLDGADAIEIVITATTNHMTSWGGTLDLTVSNTFIDGVALAVNIVAATVTVTRLEMALNGAAPLAGTLGESDRPADNPFVCAIVQNPSYNSISRITFYDPLPTTVGLSSLSAIV